MNVETLKKQCKESIKKFEDRVGISFKYIPNGIFLWEGFAFCSMLDLFDIDLIIESGIAGGRSTEIWAKYCNMPIYSIDNARYYGVDRFNETKKRLSKYDNITCIKGDAFFEIAKLIRKHRIARIAIFIDGPKGNKAILLAKNCFKYPNVKFVGIHDQNKTNYHEMDKWNKTVFYTDSPWFIERYSYLDCNNNDSTLLKELEKFPGGPGIGFAVNEESEGEKVINQSSFNNIKDNIGFYFAKVQCFFKNIRYNFKKNFPWFYKLLKKIKHKISC